MGAFDHNLRCDRFFAIIIIKAEKERKEFEKHKIIDVIYLESRTKPKFGAKGRIFAATVFFDPVVGFLQAVSEQEDVYHRFNVYYDN